MSVNMNPQNNFDLKVKLQSFSKSDNINRDANIFSRENNISNMQAKSMLESSFADHYDKASSGGGQVQSGGLSLMA